MTLFNRHGPCVGIKLWSDRKRFVQLWICPRGYTVKQHSHDDEEIELMYLFGRTTFFRVAESVQQFTPKWYHVFRSFTVKPAQIHWFSVSSLPLIFINFATFLDGKKPTSAAIDFHKT